MPMGAETALKSAGVGNGRGGMSSGIASSLWPREKAEMSVREKA
jgi:hypothetical protein